MSVILSKYRMVVCKCKVVVSKCQVVTTKQREVLVQVEVLVFLDNRADEVFMQVEVVVFDNTELRRSMQRQRFRGSCTR